jgi:hypothetical protein
MDVARLVLDSIERPDLLDRGSDEVHGHRDT